MGLKDNVQELLQLIERRDRITAVLEQLEESKEPQPYMEVGRNMVTRATLSDAAKQEFDYIAERFQGMLQIEVTAVGLDIDRGIEMNTEELIQLLQEKQRAEGNLREAKRALSDFDQGGFSTNLAGLQV